jgi:ATP-binding cassette subfamily F protein 3
LDIESIIWLESFLNTYHGAVVIVSHDKMFLDHVTNRTIEISLGKIYDYPHAYSKYLILRAEQKALQIASQKNQQKQIQHTEKLIEKFRAKASKATMAQSLIKKLDRMELIAVDEDDNSVMNVNFPVSIIPGKVVVEAENISKSYGDLQVLKSVNLLVERGSKIAFIGQNGQGKSTLAKIIVGEITANGMMKLGHNVQVGYFAQNQAEYLDGQKTVLDTMIDAASEHNRAKVRDILGAFLFKGEAVDKYVKVLSGGERNRLALDEPTNHLDIKSKTVLKHALQQFEGTLILVSHDRDFLQGITNIVYEFKDQFIKQFLGDIDYYLEQRKIQNLREAEKRTILAKSNKDKVNKGVSSYEEQKKLKSLRNRLSKTEILISSLESEIKAIDVDLEINYDQVVSDPNFFDKYQNKKKELDTLMARWETLTESIESLS